MLFQHHWPVSLAPSLRLHKSSASGRDSRSWPFHLVLDHHQRQRPDAEILSPSQLVLEHVGCRRHQIFRSKRAPINKAVKFGQFPTCWRPQSEKEQLGYEVVFIVLWEEIGEPPLRRTATLHGAITEATSYVDLKLSHSFTALKVVRPKPLLSAIPIASTLSCRLRSALEKQGENHPRNTIWIPSPRFCSCMFRLKVYDCSNPNAKGKEG